MPSIRDTVGRFLRKPLEELSPAYRRRVENAERREQSRASARGHASAPKPRDSRELWGTENYEKSLRVLAQMRGGESLSAAARAEDIRPETVRRQLGAALEREGNRYQATRRDQLYRRMEFLTPHGYVPLEPADSREATKLAKYQNAVRRYIELGDEVQLGKFKGKTVRSRDGARIEFLTDLDAIDRLASAGILSFTSIYRNVT